MFSLIATTKKNENDKLENPGIADLTARQID